MLHRMTQPRRGYHRFNLAPTPKWRQKVAFVERSEGFIKETAICMPQDHQAFLWNFSMRGENPTTIDELIDLVQESYDSRYKAVSHDCISMEEFHDIERICPPLLDELRCIKGSNEQ